MSDETRPTTDYVVFAVVGTMTPELAKEASLGPEDWPLELWREPTVVSVPQRTPKAVVVERAKEAIAALVTEDTEQVRVRVFPLAEMTEAIVEIERTPTLVARIVVPGGSVASEEGAAGAESGAGGVGQGDGVPGGLTPVSGEGGNLAGGAS